MVQESGVNQRLQQPAGYCATERRQRESADSARARQKGVGPAPGRTL